MAMTVRLNRLYTLLSYDENEQLPHIYMRWLLYMETLSAVIIMRSQYYGVDTK